MNVFKLSALAGAMLLSVSGAAFAEPKTYELPEETATLKPGPDMEIAEQNCMACHSVDYISTQPPKMGAKFWTATVTKMIKTYGAAVEEADAKKIADYLAATY